MDPSTYVDPQLTTADRLVIDAVIDDPAAKGETTTSTEPRLTLGETIEKLQGMNDASHPAFDPTVFQLWDTPDLAKLPAPIQQYVLQPYINWAQGVVRYRTDVVMLTHLILYFTTLVPSAFYLYYHFTWIHGILHWAMQLLCCGAFTLMKHQHIHMNGVLAPKYWLFDTLFPYLLDPMLGHTWNSYFYHHIKHHHVEGNGANDLSTTMFYDRDSAFDFACYVGRFFFFVWLELPLYFWRKGQAKYAARAAFWELSNYATIYLLYNYVNARATLFVLILPLTVMRCGLMVGNWGQHAFVDQADPDSDYLSSITLIDVPSNRFSFNDGYHTSHHLNPRRHWRDHPVAFIKQKEQYAKERALVFRNVDYIFITVNLLRKNYLHLAKCLIPIGDQVNMTLEERAEMLRSRTRRFSRPEEKKTR
ncbi:hypothetical protein N7532_006374 [Penicillium argentinense]|uniref:Fatty acid desaturase domain-containing protein n=1 Tax=Penicillium argentinense TaxID=1131581 RepID=A0A9W9KAV8_9EURO|nr:uncharacterized protein N7532_006374 [Penicillium argentinense]KAJ5099373.1 hypothetical protein N7532_006374 [Penicillium argentinense]